MVCSASLFSFNRYVATEMGSCAWISPVRSFKASSSIRRIMDKPMDSTSLIVPWPWQRGHTTPLVSPNEGRSLWRDNSIKPKREIFPICTRARSLAKASRMRFSTSR